MGTGRGGGGPQGPPPEIRQAIEQMHREHDQAVDGLKHVHREHVEAVLGKPHHQVADAAKRYEHHLAQLRRAHTQAVDKAYQSRPPNA